MKKLIVLALLLITTYAGFSQNEFKYLTKHLGGIKVGKKNSTTTIKIDSISYVGGVLKFYNGSTVLLPVAAGTSIDSTTFATQYDIFNKDQWNWAVNELVDTIEYSEFGYLKTETYSNSQIDSIATLKLNQTNPGVIGKMTWTPTFTGSYIIGDGGQNLVNTTGSNAFHNILYGSGAGFSLTTGSWNLAAGTDALYTSTVGTYNTAVGFSSMKYSTDAVANSALGDRSLVLNTTGDYNSAYGSMALYANTTGSNNTAIGYQAGYTNQTGARNVFIGREAGYYETGSDYIYIDNTSRTSEAIGRENAWLVGKLNGNTEVQYIYANGNLRVKEAFIQATDTLTVSSAGNINNISTAVLKVAGRGAAIDITSNPQIAAGTDGQIIELHGTSDTNTLKIDTGTGVLLSTASYTLGLNDVLILRFINGVWKEINYINY